jgi:hypothetical protein
MVLADKAAQKNKKLHVGEMQNGGEIEDGHQTVKCSSYVQNSANNLKLRNSLY